MISVVIPVFNEEKSLKELYQRIVKVLKNNFEIIFVDDGSTDHSVSEILRIKEKDSRVKLARLRRNFGKSKALMMGFARAKGEKIVTLDADLQDAPEEIPKLITKLEEGYDLVVGWKRKRKDSLFIVISSRIFNFLISLFGGVKLHDINCGLKVYRVETIKDLKLYGDLYRFIPVLAVDEGFKVTEVEIEHFPRKYGRSKYGVSKIIRGFFDIFTILFLTKFRTRPLHFFGSVGILLFLFGFVINFYLTVLWLQGQTIGRRPLLILGILLIIVGIQLFSTGLLAELMVSDIFRRKEK